MEEEKGEHVQKMKSTLLLCVFQEPPCSDGGGEARARSEDEEYFIVVCVSGTPLPRWRRRRESTYRR